MRKPLPLIYGPLVYGATLILGSGATALALPAAPYAADAEPAFVEIDFDDSDRFGTDSSDGEHRWRQRWEDQRFRALPDWRANDRPAFRGGDFDDSDSDFDNSDSD